MKATNLENKKTAQVADGPRISQTLALIAKRTESKSGDRVLLEWKSGYKSTVTLIEKSNGSWEAL